MMILLENSLIVPRGITGRGRTSLVKMIRFLVSDAVFLASTPRLWPPVRRLLIAAGVWMSRLLLGLDRLDPGFGNELASRLLTVLESLLVKVPKLFLVAH